MSNIFVDYISIFKNHTEIINDNLNEVNQENKQILKINLSFSVVLFPVLFVTTILVEPERMLWVSFLVAFFISLFALKKTDTALKKLSVTNLHYLNFTLLFIACLNIGTITSSHNYNVSLPVFFALVPVIIIDTPKKLLTFLISTYLITIAFIFHYKGFTELATKDFINCTTFFMIGIFVGSGVTDIRLNNIKFKKEALQMGTIDFLTKLPNRRKLFEKFNSDIEFHAVVMLDIDNFKHYNDTFGHQEGDSVLTLISKCMMKLNPEEVEFFRYGGEEFIALYKGDSLENITEICDKINESIRQLKIPSSKTEETYVTVSIGYYFSADPITDELGIHYADIALYQSKNSGKDKSTIYQSFMEEIATSTPLSYHVK